MTNDIRETVRERYGRIATEETQGCCAPSCCGGGEADQAESTSLALGYSKEELAAIPDGADLGVGCGNPLALQQLSGGETVLDLGSGAGIDAFIAAARVGPEGKVIGVDMTPQMLQRARENAVRGNYDNVEFRLGEIESLPVADNTVDVVISNCVINLSPDKGRVFGEALRVLKPGGTLAVSDIVIDGKLPETIRGSIEAYTGCIAGASQREAYLQEIRDAGFAQVEVQSANTYPTDLLGGIPEVKQAVADGVMTLDEVKAASAAVVSVKVKAVKP
jgi:SAM-dependent methyltransferase